MNKRQRILDGLLLAAPLDGELSDNEDEADAEPELVPMTYEDITSVGYERCFACENITAVSLRQNEYYLNMMRLYTENSSSICKPAIYRLIKQYFDSEIMPELEESCDWTLDCIREHFTTHTMYPTDEILTQIHISAGLRKHLMNNLAKREVPREGTMARANTPMKFDINNIKVLMQLNKELRVLRNMKSGIPAMVGFDPNLNY